MSNFNLSINMNLPIPVVGVDLGPDWALNLNNALTIVDGHNHSAGNGVQIVPSGLNINSDLTFNNQNAVDLRSVRFFSQASPINLAADLNCLSVSGVDLYYNDGLGNIIRMTQSGNVAGTSGSIAGLVSPASATYVALSSTFVWQSDASTPANLDAASIILRNLVSGSNGLTLNPPAAMASNFSITFPTLPVGLSVMTLDNLGNIGTQTYDQVGQGMTSVGANAIGASMTATGANAVANTRTRAVGVTAGLGDVAQGTSTGAFTTSSATFVQVSTCTLTVSGNRPVMVMIVPDGTTNACDINTNVNRMLLDISNLSTASICRMFIEGSNSADTMTATICAIDTTIIGSPGTYTYTVAIRADSGTNVMNFMYLKPIAYEL